MNLLMGRSAQGRWTSKLFKVLFADLPKVHRTFFFERASRTLAFATFTYLSVGPAKAQVGETLLLPMVLPSGFNRGHNQSVLEIPRKAFDPAGIRVRSFQLNPSIRSGAGVTSNTYYTVDPVGSTFLTNSPSAQLISQWNRHELSLSGGGTFRQYLGQSRRNESTWQEDVRGRVDLGRFSSVTIEQNSAQLNENQFTGETTPTFAALSRYRRDLFSVRVVNQVGRIRLSFASDYTLLRFQPLPLLTGQTVSQRNRDRRVTRITGQIEYGLSPNVAFFAQASFAGQSYETLLAPTIPNLDSTAFRVIGGANFDDPGFARGTLGIGYTRQSFSSDTYKVVGGLSVEGQAEFFPARLTTILFAARRNLEVTNLGNRGAYWNNRTNLRVDREVWRSIILNITAEYSHQSYVATDLTANSYQFGLGGSYFSSRRMVFDATINYGNRGAASNVLGNGFSEARGEIGMTFRI